MSIRQSRIDLSPQMLEEASAWVIEFHDGEVDASQRAEFNYWIRRSPEHIQAYLEIAAAWEESGRLDKHRALDPTALIEQALAESNVVALDAFNRSSETLSAPMDGILTPVPSRKALSRSSPSLQPPSPSDGEGTGVRNHGREGVRYIKRLAIAASVLIVVGSLVTGGFLQRNTYATGTGEQRSLVLTDGSTIELNARSKLRVDFTDQARNVELLEGQALFHVAKDKARPFIVQSINTRVRAVGTQFDVYRKNSGTTVTVLEGRVAINEAAPHPNPSSSDGEGGPKGRMRNDSSLFLSAGEQVTLVPNVAPSPVRANVANATAWTQRKLVFEETPLSEAVEEFNRYNARRLVIEDPAMQTFHVRGTFSATEPARLVQFLNQRFDVTVVESSTEIRIARNSSR